MIGDAEILQAEFLRGLGHLGERAAAVARGGVVVESAAQILRLDEIGQRVLFRRGEFAAILAQLRLDVIETERAVEIALLVDLRAPAGGVGPSAFSIGAEPVFVERPAAGERALAHDDVVLLRAGEVVQREGILGVLHHAQIGLDAALQPHARFRRAVRDHALDHLVLHEKLRHRPRARSWRR